MSSIPTLSPNFQSIFDAALCDYFKQTGIDLTTYPIAQALQNCHDASAVLDLFQEKARQFQAYRDGNRKLINSLKPVVQVLHTLSGILASAATLVPFQPTTAILGGIDILLSTVIRISASYDALIELFECVGNFLSRLRIHSEIPFSPSMSIIITKIMVEVLSVLSVATKQIKQGRFKKFAKKLLGEREIEDVLQRLDRLTVDEARMTGTETLHVVHSLVTNMKLVMDDGRTSMDDIRQTLVTMQQMTSEINKMKRDQLQKDMRLWLSPPDPSKSHNLARRSHHNGTAEWFTQGSTFEEWIGSGSLLWIHGKPGSGKSILCSTIIQEIEMRCDQGLAMMGYHYFDFKDIAKQGIRGLLTSLIGQLCAKSDACYQILSDLYSKNNAGSRQPGNNTLTECLKAMLKLPQQPVWYIIMDALDECSNTSGFPTPREEVLDLLEDLIGLNLPNLRMCVTSRPEIDIQTVLGALTSHQVSLHDEVGQKQDILDYISNVVHSDRKMRRWRSEDKQIVIDTLSAKVDGMFRWVYCQLETLRRCFPTVIRCALDDLPETLDETYERTLLGIEKEKREFAHRLFQCLTVAVRPLQVNELAEVLAIRFDPGQLPRYNVDWRSEDAQEAVLSACSSLITVINVDGSPVVQFSHFSVKEFLTSDRLANASESLSRYHVRPQAAHTILAQASLSILLHFGDRVDKSNFERFPFARYAAQHWVDHARFEDVSSSLEDEMEQLFDLDEPSFATWIWVYDIDHPFKQHMIEAQPTRPEAAPLYYAALCGLRNLVERLIATHPDDINVVGGYHGTPVNAALMKGNVEIALLLFEHGADVNSRGMRGKTLLSQASWDGRRDNVELLLDHHADVNLQDRDGDTPLMVAAYQGELEIVRVLLRHNAAVDTPNNQGWTPLFAASRRGHLDVFRLLIGSGAAVDTQDHGGWTPLSAASRRGHPDILRLLIESGASVNTPNDEGWTALLAASRYGHLDVVRLLLKSGAAVDTTNNGGWTALLLASRYGHLDTVRLLVESGAAVDTPNNNGWTALLLASRYGHPDIAQFLIESGAVVDIPNHEGWTPLSAASQYGQLETARLLLKCRSNANSQDRNGSTPLHMAAHNGHLEVMKLLLESGADVNVRNGRDQIPLDLSSASGYREMTWYLAEYMGVDIPPLDEHRQNDRPDAALSSPGTVEHTYIPPHIETTSLLTASEHGNVDAVRSLLDRGADANERDPSHSTPLHIASMEGNLEIADLLIKYGADVNCRDKEGWTALHVASQVGYLDVAQLLLNNGADVNAMRQDLRTPLHLASKKGHLEIAKLLFERGADVHMRDFQGHTASMVASRRGEQGIVRLLSG